MNLKKIIKEEIGDFDWIRDTDPMYIKFKEFDRVRVHNIGSNSAFIEWLGDYSDGYLNGKYGEYIEGLVRDTEDENQFCVLTNPGGDRIHFPYKKTMEHLSNMNPYHGLDLFYEPI